MNVAAAAWSRRLSRLTAAELRLLIEAQVVLAACQFAKWQRPIGRLIEWDAAEPANRGGNVDWQVVQSVAWGVTRAARHGVFRPQCLVRSLAIQRMLRRRGILACSLNVGVRMQNGSFQAHAWVELEGAVIGDTRQHVSTFSKVTDLRLVEL